MQYFVENLKPFRSFIHKLA